MGRLRVLRSLQPGISCSKYKRLEDGGSNSSSERKSSGDAGPHKRLGSPAEGIDTPDSVRGKSGSSEGRKKTRHYKRKKPDCSRQLIQDTFQELMSYSCGQCGHVQTLQVSNQQLCICNYNNISTWIFKYNVLLRKVNSIYSLIMVPASSEYTIISLTHSSENLR